MYTVVAVAHVPPDGGGRRASFLVPRYLTDTQLMGSVLSDGHDVFGMWRDDLVSTLPLRRCVGQFAIACGGYRTFTTALLTGYAL